MCELNFELVYVDSELSQHCQPKKGCHFDLNRQMLKSLRVDHYCSDYYVSSMLYVLRHIMAIQAQIEKKMVGRNMKNHFHTCIGPPDLKFIESLWDVLEETLQSAGLLHCQYKILTKHVCTFDGNNITFISIKRYINIRY